MVHLEDEPNAGKAWTESELDLLRRLADQHMPTRTIAEQLGRSEYSVRSKASQVRIMLHGAKTPIEQRRPR